MMVLTLMIPASLLLAIFFLVIFLRAVNDGQMDDLDTPALRILNDDNDIERTLDDDPTRTH